MPEQPIDTRFPGQRFPVGSVVTFLDRNRRAVSGTVTEMRRHEAIVAGGETGRWRVRYAGLQLVKRGPPGGATMQHAGRGPRRRATRTPPQHGRPRDVVALPLRDRHEPHRHLWVQHQDHRALGQLRAPSALERHPRHAHPRDRTRDRRPGHTHDAVWQTAARRIGCTANRCSTVNHSLKRWIGECPRCRDRWFRQRLTAKVRQRSICPRCRSRIAWRINAHREGR